MSDTGKLRSPLRDFELCGPSIGFVTCADCIRNSNRYAIGPRMNQTWFAPAKSWGNCRSFEKEPESEG